jgi:hypothetical protein
MASAKHGFNVRFDLYHPPLKYSANTAPAINVRKGYVGSANGNWCHPHAVPADPYGELNTTVSGLPRDLTWESEFKGNADWNCATYWTKNHTVAGVPRDPPPGCTNPATTSRYDVYRYEIQQNIHGDWSGNGAPNLSGADSGTGESGKPYCAGAGNGVDKTTGFGDFFVTEPMGADPADPSDPLFGEFSKIVTFDDGHTIYGIVQLYR